MLIGYVCVGSEARVAGMTADENFVDVGLGIRPNITGRGASRALLAATLAALEQCLGSDSFRSVVASWNQRAQRAAEHAGFRATGRHENERGSYIVFARSSSLND
jgi:ribosomal-protein-alanine N-acetyltransferase